MKGHLCLFILRNCDCVNAFVGSELFKYDILFTVSIDAKSRYCALKKYLQFASAQMVSVGLLAHLKNQPIGSLCVTHILALCSYFKGQEQIGFNPTSWHLVTYNFL